MPSQAEILRNLVLERVRVKNELCLWVNKNWKKVFYYTEKDIKESNGFLKELGVKIVAANLGKEFPVKVGFFHKELIDFVILEKHEKIETNKEETHIGQIISVKPIVQSGEDIIKQFSQYANALTKEWLTVKSVRKKLVVNQISQIAREEIAYKNIDIFEVPDPEGKYYFLHYFKANLSPRVITEKYSL